MNLFKNKFFLALVIFFIGIASLITVFLRMPPNRVFVNENQLITSTYGISLYDKLGNLIFSVSPLNDYFYLGKAREHIENKLTGSNNGNLLEKISVSISDLFLNRKSLIWDTKGKNSKGESGENFVIKVSKGFVEIDRRMYLSVQTGLVGQSLTICPDCLVIDDKKRVYFNADLLTSEKLQNAQNLNLTVFIIGENQSLPLASKIFILKVNGQKQMEIDAKNYEVSFQEKWHLLEFKTKVKNSSNAFVNQKINVYD